MTILLFGKNGQLGTELHRRFRERHGVIALGREDVDLGDTDILNELLRRMPSISLVINAAAYTAVDRAEREKQQAMTVNTFAPRIIARETKRRNIPLIHFSSDYVFDGHSRQKPYKETDKPNPQSIYAKTKLGGEIAIREEWNKHLIFRTSGIYGGENNFVSTMFRLAAAGKTPSVVHDQTISPNYCGNVASAITTVVDHLEESVDIPWGTYHLSGGGKTTWHAFATEIFSLYQKMTGMAVARPVAVSTSKYDAAASRPAYSVLNTDLAEKIFGIRLPHWKTQFRDYLREIQTVQGGRS